MRTQFGLKNTTSYSTREVRKLAHYVAKDLGLAIFGVRVLPMRGGYRGMWRGYAWYGGQAEVRIHEERAGDDWRYWLVHGLGHELRHLHQYRHGRTERSRSSRIAAEKDCRAYADWIVAKAVEDGIALDPQVRRRAQAGDRTLTPPAGSPSG